MDNPRTYWDTFEGAYQMGHQKHRDYLLDLMNKKGIASFLDVGCGTAPLYELNQENEFSMAYKGTDYSPAMIEIAKKLFPEADFDVQDARNMDEEDNSWSAVVMMHVLDHLDNYQDAIKEAARVARNYVIIILWRAFVDEGIRLNDRNMMGKKEGEKPWEDTFLQEYSKEALEKEFKKNNLSIEEIAEGEIVNDPSRYNFIYVLKKND